MTKTKTILIICGIFLFFIILLLCLLLPKRNSKPTQNPDYYAQNITATPTPITQITEEPYLLVGTYKIEGIDTFTPEQRVVIVQFEKLLSRELKNKEVKTAKISSFKENGHIWVDVVLQDDTKETYVVLYDGDYYHNFLRCITQEEYNNIFINGDFDSEAQ